MTTTSTPSGTAASGRVAPTADRTSTPRPVGGPARRRPSRDTLAGYAFLSPWLIGFVGLTLGPMLMSLYFAFTDYNLFRSPEWIGLGNFERLLGDPKFLQSVQLTLAPISEGA